jgi:glycosyltransferase involved in cell wall biosynthesis
MLKVSCLCPTYNRAPNNLRLVEEAVEGFLRQDYPNKELLVLNDTPGQTLRFDHPQVRILNTAARCSSLGAKRNVLAEEASGELLCVWDDDDISLPWRLSQSVRLLGDAEYYNAGCYWFLDQADLYHDHGTGTSYFTSIYRKSTYLELGGTPDMSMGEDQAMDEKLRTRRVARHPPLPLEEWYYIYRWGISPAHLSSVEGDTFYAALGKLPVARGEFQLEPHWEQDYTALTRAYAFLVKCEG